MLLSKELSRRQAQTSCTRRGFIRNGAGLAAGLLIMPLASLASSQQVRKLSFHNTHTGENASAVYWAEGDYLADGKQEIDEILRDHRTDEIYPIDTDLLDLLYLLRAEVQGQRAFEIISGYRSPATNAALRKNSSGVAKRSYHMQGKAIDIRLPGCELKKLHKAAMAMRAGGVGYYPGSDFIHVDVGPYRSW
ncbi:MAG: DUF882 domain-containing protein [Gammaproteobacteria bacterium]|jgi:uncharacterized protein YcbK (DUF882 family)